MMPFWVTVTEWETIQLTYIKPKQEGRMSWVSDPFLLHCFLDISPVLKMDWEDEGKALLILRSYQDKEAKAEEKNKSPNWNLFCPV